MSAFFADVERELGPVDILVNNAGITRDAHIVLLDAARWDEVLQRQPGRRLSLRARRRARHAAAAVGTYHQRVVAERADAAAGADRLRGVEGGARRA